jgi:hypothetical protein
MTKSKTPTTSRTTAINHKIRHPDGSEMEAGGSKEDVGIVGATAGVGVNVGFSDKPTARWLSRRSRPESMPFNCQQF